MKNSLDFKNIFKRETKLASYIVICLTIVVISLSYAMFFQVDKNSKNQEVVAGDFTFTYTDGSTITSTGNTACFIPMNLDETGLYLESCGYRFSVRNAGTLKATYTLKLIQNEENNVEASKLKVILRKKVGDVYEVVDSYPKIVSEITDGILVTEEIDEKTTIEYNIQIFVEESSHIDTDASKVVSYQIEGTGVVHESQPINTVKSVSEQNKEYILSKKVEGQIIEDDETTDHNLRYIGANPNNYVSFNNELWRIIGVMNNVDDGTGKKETRIKIVRNEPIGEYSWDTSASDVNSGYGVNEWSDADVMKLLNPNHETGTAGGSLYWDRGSGICYNNYNNATTTCDFTSTGLTEDAKKLIREAVWHTGSNDGVIYTYNNILTSKFYELERSENKGKICNGGTYCNDTVNRTTTWTGYIGLMAPSDYGYATSGGSTTDRDTCLNKMLYSWNDSGVTDCKTNDWLYKSGTYQWTIIPPVDTLYAHYVFLVNNDGSVSRSNANNPLIISPSLFLNSNVKIVEGEGTEGSPFQLSNE